MDNGQKKANGQPKRPIISRGKTKVGRNQKQIQQEAFAKTPQLRGGEEVRQKNKDGPSKRTNLGPQKGPEGGWM